MNAATMQKLYKAGYATREGKDGMYHILIGNGFNGAPKRGQRALCGKAATKRNSIELPICTECASKVLVNRNGEWFILHAEQQN